MVGAVLVRDGRMLGRGWHRAAGSPHAEIEAFCDAERRGHARLIRGATLFVTLEPCCTHGRTPPCTDAIQGAGISEVIVAATDPNPAHAGRGLELLRKAGITVRAGLLGPESSRLNEAFNHWITTGRPWVDLKAAMTLDGKIATRTGESKWITGPRARLQGQRLRRAADAILVGVNTVLADDPELTDRGPGHRRRPLLRVVLDTRGRTPASARVLATGSPEAGAPTILVVGRSRTSASLRSRFRRQVEVWEAPLVDGRIDVGWVLEGLGRREITRLLVEGGGGVCGHFLDRHLAQRVWFFYGPKVVGGGGAPVAVGGRGAATRSELVPLTDVEWKRLTPDLMMTGRIIG